MEVVRMKSATYYNNQTGECKQIFIHNEKDYEIPKSWDMPSWVATTICVGTIVILCVMLL